MPSFLSITLLLLFFSIHVTSSLASRRNLALADQDEDLPLKPPSKKKFTLIDRDQDVLNPKKKVAVIVEAGGDLPLIKLKKKKEVEAPLLKLMKKVVVEEEERIIPLVKPKKKVTAVVEEDSELAKPKKKVIIAEEDEAPPLKPKKKVGVEEEERSIPLVKPKKKVPVIEEDSQLTKPKKKVIIVEEDETPPFKLKKKVLELNEGTNKKNNFDSKNQTKLMKPKKTNSTTITKPKKTNSTASKTQHLSNPTEETAMASWFDSDDITTIPDDLISDFRELPSRLLPDLSRLSSTSKAYISRANLEIAKNVKPYVGRQAAATVASIASAALLALPLLLLTVVFHRIKTYLTLQRLLIFIQAYLAIYFATLAFTALLTGLEPLRFFAAASPPSYAVVQTIQTLGYVIYLVVQMLHVAAGGEGRWLGVAQMVLGLAVGVHYYAAVFHRAVAGEPPRANWKVHAVYAGCFVVICACARAERRKKAYLAGGGGDDDGKKS